MKSSRFCIHYVSKSGRSSSGLTGKGPSSSQFPKRVVPKNVLTIGQLCNHWAKKCNSSPMLVVKSPSRVRLLVTPWTAAYQAPPSMGFSRQEYWSGVPLPSPRYTLLLLPSHFSRVRLCATPQMAAHQAPPSLGFSRQEHWSGLPFPSPMHESEK